MRASVKGVILLSLFLWSCAEETLKSGAKLRQPLLGDLTNLANINASGNSTPAQLVISGGVAFFRAFEGTYGNELYYSVGSSAALVQDVCPGSCDSTPNLITPLGIDGVCYVAYHPSYGNELWCGNLLGTALVSDMTAGVSGTDIREVTQFGNYVYFSGSSGLNRYLYRANTSGVAQVGTVSNPNHLKVIDGYLYFGCDNGSDGQELCRTDGTTTGLVADVRPGAASSSPREIVGFDGAVYFLADDGTHGEELYTFDGSSATLVTDIVSGSGTPFGADTKPQLTAVGSRLFFCADNGSNADEELWSWDGSSAARVTDIESGSGSSNPGNLTAVGTTALYFVANKNTSGTELWMTYADSPAAVLVKDIRAGASSSSPDNFVVVGNGLYFTAYDGTNNSTWLVDAHGARVVAISASSYPLGYLPSTGDLILAYNDGSNGLEPWLMDAKRPSKMDDGTGLALVQSNIHVVGGTGYFAAQIVGGTGIGVELYASDGASVALVKNINTGVNDSSPLFLTSMGSTLYFAAEDAVVGRELFKSDGTSGGTGFVCNIMASTASSDPQELVVLGGKLYFTADDGTGRAIHVYDAGLSTCSKLAGTTISPQKLTVAANRLFFVGTDGTNGEELWSYDPSSGTTALRSQIGAGALDALITEMVAFNSQLYFVATHSTNGQQFFRSNGTGTVTSSYTSANSANGGLQPTNLKVLTLTGGTFLFFNGYNAANLALKLSTSSATPSTAATCTDAISFAALSGAAYFACGDGTNGVELWKTNTSGASGTIHADINVGAASSDPILLGTAASRLYMSVTDGSSGRELFYRTGTGVASQHDLNPGPGDSDPSDLTPVTAGTIFVADDGVNGRILWSADNL